MVDWKRYASLGLVILGLAAATVGADLVSSPRLALGLALGGSLAAWGTLFVTEAVFDNCFCGPWLADERMYRIYYRSSYATLMALLGIMSTVLLTMDHLGRPVAAENLLLGLLALGLVVYLGSMTWYDRSM